MDSLVSSLALEFAVLALVRYRRTVVRLVGCYQHPCLNQG